jgi:hypothetical protein
MKVKWIPQNEFASKFIDPPKPAKNYMPDWYKKLPPFSTGNRPRDFGKRTNTTAKHCMPLFDSFTTGYIQETWCDMAVTRLDNEIQVSFSAREQDLFVDGHDKNPIFPETGYYDKMLAWWTQWEPQTPKGWSTLYTHPLNQNNLPFYTMSGVIDTDRWPIGGKVQFYIKDGFEGIIPKGTPMYQMIFFKRENWKSEVSHHDQDWFVKTNKKVFDYFHSGYRNNIWVKKNYE